MERALRFTILWLCAGAVAYFGLLAAASAETLAHPGTSMSSTGQLRWNLAVSLTVVAACTGVALAGQVWWWRQDRRDRAAGRDPVGG